MSRRACFLAFTVLITPRVSWAAEAVPESTETSTRAEAADAVVDEVHVSAEREHAPPVADPTATASEVPEHRLERAKARGEEIASVVEAAAGAHLVDLGGPVAERRLSVRGGAPSQALVIVDGVHQSSPFATGLDLGTLDVQSLESVQLVRGGAGALYGDGALTGALVLRTMPPSATPEGSVLLSYGSFDTKRIAARASLAPVALTGSFEQTAGDFAYVQRQPGLPDLPEVRQNADATRGTIALRADDALSALGAGGRLSVTGGASFREGGVPGFETQKNLDARERRATGQLRAEVVRPLEGRSSLSFVVSTWLLDIDYRAQVKPSSTFFYTLGAESSLDLRALEGHALKGTLAFERQQADFTLDAGERTPSRLRGSAALSDEVLLFGELVAFVALRAEALSGQGVAVLPRLGLRYEPSTLWAVSIAVGRSLRSPAIDELYHPAEPGFEGNAGLVSETAWEAEASLALTPEELPHLRLTTFARRVSDTIIYSNRSAYLIRPENLGDARAAGLEAELGWAREVMGARLWLDVSSTLLTSELALTGEPLPTRPSWSAGGEVGLRAGPVAVFTAVRAFAATTANVQGTLEVPEYLRWDAGLEVTPTRWTVLSLSAVNLLDDRTLETMNKLPLPGRAIFMALRVATDAPKEGS